MATRSLTEFFVLLRNNAIQSRHIYSEQGNNEDQIALIRSDPETGDAEHDTHLLPEWVDTVKEIKYEMTKIRQKMKELVALHDKHIHRPTLDDSTQEEEAMQSLTIEITQLFGRCQKRIFKLKNKSSGGSRPEQKISQNIFQSLISSLQELSTDFRKCQSQYLKKIQSREERASQYFDNSYINMYEEEEIVMDEPTGLNREQLFYLEENTTFMRQREKEINQIVKSLADVNGIFKDLATLVSDQGTVLDRIDYNIEQSHCRVEEGLTQLHKAATYQRKSRKVKCILISVSFVIVLTMILIIFKS